METTIMGYIGDLPLFRTSQQGASVVQGLGVKGLLRCC